MRPFKIKTDIVAGDKASAVFAKITGAAASMAKTVNQSARIAGESFTTLGSKIGLAAKRAQVGLNTVNSNVNNLFRNIGKKVGTLGALGLGIGFFSIASAVIDANVQLDASFASLSAITGKTGAQFEVFKQQVSNVAKEQLLFGGDTAKAFEIVASAKPELLDNAEALGKVTNAAITLSKASGDDLAMSAMSLAGVMNQFSLDASHAERVMNTLAAGSLAGSANITDVAASMKNFGAVAANANISMEKAVALVEVMGSKSIFAEEAGTKLRGSILKLQQAGLGYASGQFDINDALTEAKAKMDKLSTAQKKDAFLLKTFGAENITTGQILLSNIGMFNDLSKAVTGTDTAITQANINNNTFKNRLEEIRNSFKNAVSATGEQGAALQKVKDIMKSVAENMDKIIGFVVKGVEAFALFKATVYGLRIVTTAYNIALGVQAGLLQRANISMKNNLTAIKAMNIVTKIATGVQWLFNAALYANPIVWIVAAVLALVAAIAALIYYWKDIVEWVKTSNNWFAKLIRFAIYPLIMGFKMAGVIIEWISTKFSQLVEWVKTSDSWFADFIRFSLLLTAAAFKAIGTAIDWVITKFSQLVEWVKTSDSWFAQFIRKAIEGFVGFFSFIGFLVDSFIQQIKDLFSAIGKVINFFSGETQKELGVNINKTETKAVTVSASAGVGAKASDTQAISSDLFKETELTKALNKNTTAIDTNTKKNEWSGRFRTTILKDLNAPGTSIAQKELAISAITGETSNAVLQNEIVSKKEPVQEVFTPNQGVKKSKNNNVNGVITVNVVNRTGGKFGLEIEGSGVNVVTTGNQ